ncbi:MAG: hypothetical protein KAU90_01285, partial [Sulfurovaceae bacterium]|nr:hypothetical protein [Sulfurovaceae bacterium]
MKNIIYTIKWLVKRPLFLKKELKNLYQKIVYQPQSQFLLSNDVAPLCPLEPIKFYSFMGRMGFAFREFIALISNGVIFKKRILLDGFDNIYMNSIYTIGHDEVPHPKPPLVELEKYKKLDNNIFKSIEKSYLLANDNDPDKFDRALWWEEMSQAFKRELFDNQGNINQDYLVNFRGLKELP